LVCQFLMVQAAQFAIVGQRDHAAALNRSIEAGEGPLVGEAHATGQVVSAAPEFPVRTL